MERNLATSSPVLSGKELLGASVERDIIVGSPAVFFLLQSQLELIDTVKPYTWRNGSSQITSVLVVTGSVNAQATLRPGFL